MPDQQHKCVCQCPIPEKPDKYFWAIHRNHTRPNLDQEHTMLGPLPEISEELIRKIYLAEDDVLIDPLKQARGILKGLRVILEVPEGESILTHASTIMRRYKQLKEKEDASRNAS